MKYRLLALIGVLNFLLTGCEQTPIIVKSNEHPVTVVETNAETNEPDQSERITISEVSTEQLTEKKSEIVVHVCGAVAMPGVYILEESARIVDAVRMAGGFLEQADTEWCNQAMVLCDGDKLKIYSIEETDKMREQGITPAADYSGVTPALSPSNMALHTGQSEKSSDSRLINLNTASKEELMSLPGIGEARADDIIAYRDAHGPFSSIEQIMEISGIKTSLYSRISELITV